MSDIGIYVPSGSAGGHEFKNNCFDKRRWTGLMVVRDSLIRAGYSVDFCSSATVNRFKLVFASLTSPRSTYEFWQERVQWAPGDYKVAIGGPGALNPLTLMDFCDYIQLGRGEKTSVELAEAVLKGHTLHGESVIHVPDYSLNEEYRLAQVDVPYPFEIGEEGKRLYKENSIGCPHKCAFCLYSWSRKHIGGDFANDGLGEGQERSLLDLKKNGYDDLEHLRITALNGSSERLRRLVNKPIPNDVFAELLCHMAEKGNRVIKVFNVIALPSETREDQMDLLHTLDRADELCDPSWGWVKMQMHCTPFEAEPFTPMACSPMAYREMRETWGNLRPWLGRYQIASGNHVKAAYNYSISSLSGTVLNALAFRGGRKESEIVRKLALSKRFWNQDAAGRISTIESVVDARRIMRAYDPSDLPTANIRTYARVERLYDKYRYLPPATTGARR